MPNYNGQGYADDSGSFSDMLKQMYGQGPSGTDTQNPAPDAMAQLRALAAMYAASHDPYSRMQSMMQPIPTDTSGYSQTQIPNTTTGSGHIGPMRGADGSWYYGSPYGPYQWFGQGRPY